MISWFSVTLLFCFYQAGITAEILTVAEKNGNSISVQLLRGRDGRDGLQGPPGPQGPPGAPIGGAIYTRWGNSSCPEVKGTELLYSGITGGTHSAKSGGGANHLCLPQIAEYSPELAYSNRIQEYAEIQGVKYGDVPLENYAELKGLQYGEIPLQKYAELKGMKYGNVPLQGTQDRIVPCAVCYVSTRSAVLMVPAKASCPPAFTKEYLGYLMTGKAKIGESPRTLFECVDRDQKGLPINKDKVYGYKGLPDNQDKEDIAQFEHIEADCNGLPCPPYQRQKELNCVVCTK